MTEQDTTIVSPHDAILAAAARADRLLLDTYDARLRAIADAAEASLGRIAARLGGGDPDNSIIGDTWCGFWGVQAVEQDVALVHALTSEAILWGLAREHAASEGLWCLPGHEGTDAVREMLAEVEARRDAVEAAN